MKHKVNRFSIICYKNKKNKCFTAWYSVAIRNKSKMIMVRILNSQYSGSCLSKEFEDELVQVIGSDKVEHPIVRIN